jgi:hypothetical protein
MNPVDFLANAVRRLASMYQGYFPDAKHDHYKDYGWPDCVTFEMAYGMYSRNGYARAAVNKTILKTWESFPFLLEKARDGTQTGKVKETKTEADIRQRFDDIRFWQNCAEADRRGMVGRYAGLILRVADSKTFNQPVDRVPGGILGLVEVIPAWEGQLLVSEWDDDQTSETYGLPKMFQFNEAAVGAENRNNQRRQFDVHPDRVVIWSANGKPEGSSDLEPGYNDLFDIEKVKGGGAEGFWKNAKSAPVIQVDKEARLESMAAMFGVPVDQLADKMGEQVDDWQKGFDKLLMLQGMEAKALNITMPQPAEFIDGPKASFAASMGIPIKILEGMQTGERASTEDADEWAQTNMSRRTNIEIPAIMETVRRLERFGILPEKDWALDWADLTEAKMSEKMDRAAKMAEVNSKMQAGGELVYTPEEIRGVTGLEPLADSEKYADTNEDDVAAALPGPAQTPPKGN